MAMSSDLRVEDVADPVADGVVDRLQLEFAGQRFLDAIDQRELGVALPGLIHEARVLERHAQAASQRLEELLVRVAERVCAVDVLQRDHADSARTDDERDEDLRLRRLPTQYGGVAVALERLRRELLEHQRLARFHHMLAEADQLHRLVREPHAALDRVRKVEQAGGLVVDADVEHLRVEDVADPVADGVVDRLQLEFAGDRCPGRC